MSRNWSVAMLPRGLLWALLLGLLLGPMLAGAAAPGHAGERLRLALFDLELIDTSGYGDGVPERQRLELVRLVLAEGLAASGRYLPIDSAVAAEELAAVRSPRSCPPCALAAAERIGAERALVGWVQKVSNLILNMNLALYEAPSGRLLEAASVDFRGNTDEAWSRAARYLLREQLLRE